MYAYGAYGGKYVQISLYKALYLCGSITNGRRQSACHIDGIRENVQLTDRHPGVVIPLNASC